MFTDIFLAPLPFKMQKTLFWEKNSDLWVTLTTKEAVASQSVLFHYFCSVNQALKTHEDISSSRGLALGRVPIGPQLPLHLYWQWNTAMYLYQQSERRKKTIWDKLGSSTFPLVADGEAAGGILVYGLCRESALCYWVIIVACATSK
jgi:hypothetical protein